MRGLRHVAACEVDDLSGHRGREKHGLTDCRSLRHQALDVGQEAHIEHLVGFVEHEYAHLREVEVALLGEVDEATRGSDHHLDALA